MGNGGCGADNNYQQHQHESVWDTQISHTVCSSPLHPSYCKLQQWRCTGTGSRPGSGNKTYDPQTFSTSSPAVGSEAPSGASHDGSERGHEETDVWVQYNVNRWSDRAHDDGTHRDVTAVDQYLHNWVVLIWIHRGQVIQEAVDRSVNPLSEFAGQMFSVTLLKLPFEDVWKNLQAMKGKSQKVQSHFCR